MLQQKMPKVATFVLILCLMGASEAGKLTAKYLPPHYAASSAGIGAGLLQSPSRTGAFGGSSGGGSGGGYGRPSSQYLAPQASHLHYHGVSAQARPQHVYQQSASRTAVVGGAPQIPILRNDYTNDANGNYNFGFDTGNGIHRDETGEFRGGWPHGSQSVKGSYSYTGDDGQIYTVNYKADGNGFRAEGAHLPTPPPIPAEIQESLALHRSNAVHGHGSGSGVGSGAYHAAASSLHASPATRYLPPPAQPQQQQQQQHQGYNYGNRRHY